MAAATEYGRCEGEKRIEFLFCACERERERERESPLEKVNLQARVNEKSKSWNFFQARRALLRGHEENCTFANFVYTILDYAFSTHVNDIINMNAHDI